MEILVKILAGSVGVIALLFLVVIFSTLIGGIAGWVVGAMFADTILALKQFMGVSVTNFELGAALGFVGGFFRSSVSSK